MAPLTLRAAIELHNPGNHEQIVDRLQNSRTTRFPSSWLEKTPADALASEFERDDRMSSLASHRSCAIKKQVGDGCGVSMIQVEIMYLLKQKVYTSRLQPISEDEFNNLSQAKQMALRSMSGRGHQISEKHARQSAALTCIIKRMEYEIAVVEKLADVAQDSIICEVDAEKDRESPFRGNIKAGQRNESGEFQDLLTSLISMPEAECEEYLHLLGKSKATFLGKPVITGTAYRPKRNVTRPRSISGVGIGINGVHNYWIDANDNESCIMAIDGCNSVEFMNYLGEYYEERGKVGLILEQLLHQQQVDSHLPLNLFIARDNETRKWYRLRSKRTGVAERLAADGSSKCRVSDYAIHIPGHGPCCGMVFLAAMYAGRRPKIRIYRATIGGGDEVEIGHNNGVVGDRWFFLNPYKSPTNSTKCRTFAAYGYNGDIFSFNGMHSNEYLVAKYGCVVRKSPVYKRYLEEKKSPRTAADSADSRIFSFRAYDSRMVAIRLHEHSDDFVITRIATCGSRAFPPLSSINIEDTDSLAMTDGQCDAIIGHQRYDPSLIENNPSPLREPRLKLELAGLLVGGETAVGKYDWSYVEEKGSDKLIAFLSKFSPEDRNLNRVVGSTSGVGSAGKQFTQLLHVARVKKRLKAGLPAVTRNFDDIYRSFIGTARPQVSPDKSVDESPFNAIECELALLHAKSIFGGSPAKGIFKMEIMKERASPDLFSFLGTFSSRDRKKLNIVIGSSTSKRRKDFQKLVDSMLADLRSEASAEAAASESESESEANVSMATASVDVSMDTIDGNMSIDSSH